MADIQLGSNLVYYLRGGNRRVPGTPLHIMHNAQIRNVGIQIAVHQKSDCLNIGALISSKTGISETTAKRNSGKILRIFQVFLCRFTQPREFMGNKWPSRIVEL